MKSMNNPMIEQLEDRKMFSITYVTTYQKTPGPTDLVVVTAYNPDGQVVPGQSYTYTIPNKDFPH